jgi:hypothetical protein
LNERDPSVPVDDAFDLVRSIAVGSLRDVPDIAAPVRAWMVDLGTMEVS